MNHLIAIFLALATASAGHAVVVSGTVTDSAGDLIDGMRVELWSENPFGDGLFDELLDVVYTENGTFSSDAAEPGHDVFARVKWEFALLPSNFYNGHVVRILDMGPGVPNTGTTTFTERTTDTLDDISEGGTWFFDIRMDQIEPFALDVLVSRIQETLDFVRINVADRQDINWVVDYDIPVHLRTDLAAAFRPGEGSILIPTVAYNGLGTASRQGILFHEVTHLTHYRHNGNSVTPAEPGCFASHTINTEEDPGCAVGEGYASYVAQLVAENHTPPIVSAFLRSYRDDGAGFFPAKTLWRGDEGGIGVSVLHTGREAGRFESGEIVEGTFAGFLFSVQGAFDFATTFAAMHNHHPETPFDVVRALVADLGAGTPAVSEIYGLMQSHGMVFSRALFAANPLGHIEEPANIAPPAPGNTKLIRGRTFLRGTVAPRVAAANATDLGVRRVNHLSQVKLGFKRASSGTSDTADLFVNFSLPIVFGFLLDKIPINTSTFDPVTSGDGRWDLIVVGENEDGFVDNLEPSWLGDPSQSNTDESYLKLLGAWFDGDGNHATEHDGMVTIDNTAPVVTEFMPQ